MTDMVTVQDTPPGRNLIKDNTVATVPANVDHFACSIEGPTGPDRAAFDNFGSSWDDLGDAPASYGTQLAGESITVTVDDPPQGDRALANRVTIPEGNCVEGSGDPECLTRVEVLVVPPDPGTPRPAPRSPIMARSVPVIG